MTDLSVDSQITPAPSIEWTEEQCIALDKIDAWHDGVESFLSLTGPAGTGKTTLLREVAERYPMATLTAMTGKAALRLSQLTRCDATTLHSKLYYPPKSGEDLRFTRLREAPSLLVMTDESSMMTPSVFADLQSWGARVILIGDCFQLPPVITGKELQEYGEDYSVFSVVEGAALETVMRNSGGVLRAATKVRETGEICKESDDGYEFVRSKCPIEKAVDDYCDDIKDHLLITWRNVVRMTANKMIRERLGHEGPLPDIGEPVLIKKNGSGFLNGEIVTCGGFEDGPMIGSLQCLWMRVGELGVRLLVSVDGGNRDKGGEFFDGQMPWITDWKKYHVDLKNKCLPEPVPVTFGYCLTAHSAQGSQAERTTVFLCGGDEKNRNFNKPTTLPSGETVKFSARWIYTATTRSKSKTTMIVGR